MQLLSPLGSVAQFPLPPEVKQETGVNKTPEVITPGDQKKSVAQGKKSPGYQKPGVEMRCKLAPAKEWVYLYACRSKTLIQNGCRCKRSTQFESKN